MVKSSCLRNQKRPEFRSQNPHSKLGMVSHPCSLTPLWKGTQEQEHQGSLFNASLGEKYELQVYQLQAQGQTGPASKKWVERMIKGNTRCCLLPSVSINTGTCNPHTHMHTSREGEHQSVDLPAPGGGRRPQAHEG